MRKNKKLSTLLSKKIKLGTKLADVDKVLSEKSKQKMTTEQQLDGIEAEIITQQLPNYVITLDLLNSTLLNTLPEEKVISIMQTLSKKCSAIQEFKRNDNEQVIDVTTCTCEGRLNVCVDSENCPIESKPKCDGRKTTAVFINKD
jgi:flagellar biosynthesis regulator FlaF